MSQSLFKLSLNILAVAIMACTSTPPVTEFSNTADPAKEMAQTENLIQEAVGNQMDVLSPQSFKEASKALSEAKAARSENRSQKDVLHSIALSRAYLNRAANTGRIVNQLIPDVVAERQSALNAEAPGYFPNALAAIDRDLVQVTKKIEANDTLVDPDERSSLVQRYNGLELQTIRQAKLGGARLDLAAAKREGAEKLVPITLAWAEKNIKDSDAVITANRHNPGIVERASEDATQSAERLLNMVRKAKSVAQLSPEQQAAAIEETQDDAKIASTKLAQTKSELESKNATITSLDMDNQELEAKGQLEIEYESARKLFTKDEAEVYKQGNKLLLRLKGLTFPKGKAILGAQNYPLLAKVQTVLKNNEDSKVLVQGHTDSTGQRSANIKLSEDRAQSVAKYFLANNSVNADTIATNGVGDAEPVASNKTAEGRAQNRRVDVIISSDHLAW